jgi:hypothetical protein
MSLILCAPFLLPLLQAQPSLEVRNLGALHRSGFSRGVLTLEDDFLVLTEPEFDGETRTIAYASRGGTRELARTTFAAFRLGHRQLGPLVVTMGSESLMGDLNGDGDVLDASCVIATDLASGAALSPRAILTPTAGSSSNPALAPDTVAFLVSEAGDGVNYNQDGDTTDFLPAVWRASTDQSTVAGHAAGIFDVFPGVLAYVVYESAAHRDWTGDGDQSDLVPFIHDTVLGVTVNTRVAKDVSTLLRGGGHSERVCLFAASEEGSGRDLDGDGVVKGNVLYAYSIDRHVLESLGRTGVTSATAVADSWVAFGREESFYGDLNGDGDVLDEILFTYDGRDGTIRSVGRALAGTPLPALGNSVFLFWVSEASEGADRNGDGDTIDYVTFVLDLGTGAVTDSMLAGGLGDGVFYVPESSNGIDFNGDGDRNDSVLHLIAHGAFPAVTLGLAAGSVRLGNGRAAFSVAEAFEGRDLNGDGDLSDGVLHAYDRRSGVTSNLGLDPSGGYWAMGSRFVLVPLDESGQDLNGDGDALDSVLHLVDPQQGTLTGLRLAVRPEDPILMSDELTAFVVSEAAQGADLDGNGLVEDVGVVHVLEPRALRRR